MRKAAFLVRLYPRRWRRRYGDEFLALLESSRLDRRLVLDVVRGAAREWLEHTLTGRLVLGPIVAFAATLCAMGLSALVPVEPTIWQDAGRTIVAPPWPVRLGIFFPIVYFAVALRYALGIAVSESRVGSRELCAWTAVLFLTSVGAQWGSMVLWLGTGIPPEPILGIWGFAAILITGALIFLLSISRGFPIGGRDERSPYSPSSRPLGL
jgi:hypothetical protein